MIAPVARSDRDERVLIVDADARSRSLLQALLPQYGYRVEGAATGEAALKLLERDPHDIVLLDLHLPNMDGLDVLDAAQALEGAPGVIVMAGHGPVDAAVAAMRRGASDFLEKPLQTNGLLSALERAGREGEARRELARLRQGAWEGSRGGIIGRSLPIQRMFDMMERVASTRATVLVTGETGTGKELVARAIHALSPRASRPFIATNCSAVPETLLESELFGHLKGSFTGAIASRRGLFEEADGSTILLDEIGTISPAIQVKLLRVLQERVIHRVGGGAPIPVDFRLMAATNVDLVEEVSAGRFREDLFYRLNVFPIRVPPLREREDDIALLAQHFRARAAQENGIQAPEIPAETMERMVNYDWPGNVRELENFIERAVITYAREGVIRFDVPERERRRAERELLHDALENSWPLARLEKEYTLQVLEKTGGHRARAARALGISRRTLFRKLKSYQAIALRLLPLALSIDALL